MLAEADPLGTEEVQDWELLLAQHVGELLPVLSQPDVLRLRTVSRAWRGAFARGVRELHVPLQLLPVTTPPVSASTSAPHTIQLPSPHPPPTAPSSSSNPTPASDEPPAQPAAAPSADTPAPTSSSSAVAGALLTAPDATPASPVPPASEPQLSPETQTHGSLPRVRAALPYASQLHLHVDLMATSDAALAALTEQQRSSIGLRSARQGDGGANGGAGTAGGGAGFRSTDMLSWVALVSHDDEQWAELWRQWGLRAAVRAVLGQGDEEEAAAGGQGDAAGEGQGSGGDQDGGKGVAGHSVLERCIAAAAGEGWGEGREGVVCAGGGAEGCGWQEEEEEAQEQGGELRAPGLGGRGLQLRLRVPLQRQFGGPALDDAQRLILQRGFWSCLLSACVPPAPRRPPSPLSSSLSAPLTRLRIELTAGYGDDDGVLAPPAAALAAALLRLPCLTDLGLAWGGVTAAHMEPVAELPGLRSLSVADKLGGWRCWLRAAMTAAKALAAAAAAGACAGAGAAPGSGVGASASPSQLPPQPQAGVRPGAPYVPYARLARPAWLPYIRSLSIRCTDWDLHGPDAGGAQVLLSGWLGGGGSDGGGGGGGSLPLGGAPHLTSLEFSGRKAYISDDRQRRQQQQQQQVQGQQAPAPGDEGRGVHGPALPLLLALQQPGTEHHATSVAPCRGHAAPSLALAPAGYRSSLRVLSFQARTLTCGDWDALSGLAGLRELRINGWRLGQAAQGFLEPTEGEEAAAEEEEELKAEPGCGGDGGGGVRCGGVVPGRLCLPGLELLMIAVRSAGQLVRAVGWLPGLKVAHVSIWAAAGTEARGGEEEMGREGGGTAAGCGSGGGAAGPGGEPGERGGGNGEGGEERGGAGEAAAAAAVLRLWRPLMRCGQLQEVNVSCVPTPLLPLEAAGLGAGGGEGNGGSEGGDGGMVGSEGCARGEGSRANAERAGGEVLRALAASWPRLRAFQYSAGEWEGLGEVDWAVLAPAEDTGGHGKRGAREGGDSVAGATAPAAVAGNPAGAVAGTCCDGSTKAVSEGGSAVEGEEAKAAAEEESQGSLHMALPSLLPPPAAAPPARCWQALGVLSLGSSQAGGGAYDGTTPRHVVPVDELPYTLHTLSLLGAELRGAAAAAAPAHGGCGAAAGSWSGTAGAGGAGPALAGDVFPPGLQLLSLKWCRWRVPGVSLLGAVSRCRGLLELRLAWTGTELHQGDPEGSSGGQQAGAGGGGAEAGVRAAGTAADGAGGDGWEAAWCGVAAGAGCLERVDLTWWADQPWSVRGRWVEEMLRGLLAGGGGGGAAAGGRSSGGRSNGGGGLGGRLRSLRLSVQAGPAWSEMVDWGVLRAGQGLVALQVEGLGLAAARRIREHVLPHLPHCRPLLRVDDVEVLEERLAALDALLRPTGARGQQQPQHHYQQHGGQGAGEAAAAAAAGAAGPAGPAGAVAAAGAGGVQGHGLGVGAFGGGVGLDAGWPGAGGGEGEGGEDGEGEGEGDLLDALGSGQLPDLDEGDLALLAAMEAEVLGEGGGEEEEEEGQEGGADEGEEGQEGQEGEAGEGGEEEAAGGPEE